MNVAERLQAVLDMPPERRRRIRRRSKCKVKPFTLPDKKNYTQQELLQWARERGVSSQRQLLAKRQDGDPNRNSFIRAFGSWSEFKRKLEGKKDDPSQPQPPEATAGYILKNIVDFDLWTVRLYMNARKKNPDTIPSMEKVKYHFGVWSNACYYASLMSAEIHVERYRQFKREKGRYPTVPECRRDLIDIGLLTQIHGSKRSLDAHLDQLEQMNEDRKRSKGKV